MENNMISLDDDYLMSEGVGESDQGLDNENNLMAEESITNSAKVRKGKHKRRHSRCWNSFRIIGDRYPDGKSDCQCKRCGLHKFVDLHRNGTSTLLRHMKVCAKTHGSTPSARKIDMMVFREMIAIAIIEHDLPYSFVEYRRVREAFAYVNPNIDFWSRNTAAADVLKIYEKEKQKLRQILSDVPGRVCLTTDLWRAITIEGYLCLTAHYVDANWNLKAKIVAFCAFPPPHSGIGIAMKLIELLKSWGLEKKVFTITVDNASSNDNMQSVLKRQLRKDLVCNGEFFHIRCAAHILNLIVQDGISVIEEALEKIRESVKFVKASESRELMFQSCVETIGLHTKAGLVLDVATRWNSTYLMLCRALQFKEVLRNLAEVEPTYLSCPSDLEWLRAELICEFLSPFNEMTRLISGSYYPTANLYFTHVWQIEHWLRENERSSDKVIADMVGIMQLKFNKYWEDYSDILAIAAVLDPRLKFKFLEYCYKNLDISSYKSKLDHIRKKMFKLYGVHKKNTKSNVASSSHEVVLADNLPSGYSGYCAFLSQNVETGSTLDTYLDESVLDMGANHSLDVLKYWKDNAARFKELSRMACDVLCIPITTVSSESSFSAGSRVLNKYRSRLLPSNVQALICARNWLRGFEYIGEYEEEGEEKKQEGEGGSRDVTIL